MRTLHRFERPSIADQMLAATGHHGAFLTYGAFLCGQVFMYVAGAQLLFSSPRSSIPAGLCGVLAGVAYHSNFLGLKRLKVGLSACSGIDRGFVSWSPDTAVLLRRACAAHGRVERPQHDARAIASAIRSRP